MSSSWKVWATGIVLTVGIPVVFLYTRQGSWKTVGTIPSPSPSPWQPAVAMVPEPVAASVAPPAPKRVRHDGVSVRLVTQNPKEDWLLRETAPFVVPDTEPRPITLLFHAVCSEPVWICDWLQYSDLAPQWQVCPRAPVYCGGNGYQWTGSKDDTLRLVQLSVNAVKERHGEHVRDDTMVFVGMSQGAFAVAQLVSVLARQEAPSWHLKGIVFHGAAVTLVPGDVRRLGARVGMAAGELDGAASAMRSTVHSLQRAGVEARFVSLGPVGHFLPVETASAMAELIDWTRGAPER